MEVNGGLVVVNRGLGGGLGWLREVWWWFRVVWVGLGWFGGG